MEKIVGIDFGACNIKTAHWRGKGTHVVRLSQNVDQNYIPNLVLYDLTRSGALETKIGDPAKAEQDPENSIEHVKRKLELPEWSKPIPNLQREVSASEAAADIFRGLSEKLQSKLSCQAEELHAVITVPVCSSGLQRSRIYQAALAAGLAVEAVITEPFAAVFSLSDVLEAEDSEETVLIFDFGGSTLDLSLVRLEHDDDGLRIEEMAAAGLPYGGIDIDAAVLKLLENKYASVIAEIKSHDKTLEQKHTSKELRDLVTVLKEKLCEDDNDSVERSCTFYGSGELREFELTRQEMEEVLRREQVREKVFGLLDELFAQTYLNKSEVTLVKTFGGTSRIKYVLDLLTEYFGADIFDSDDYEWEDETIADVAAGAVRYLAVRREQPDDIEIISQVPFSLGLAQGKLFKKYLDFAPPYGQRTKRIPLPWAELAQRENKVSVYQCFADSEGVEIGGDDGAVYIGSAAVTPSLYKAEDGILLQMELADSNTLRLIFSEMGESGLKEIETQIINLNANV
ncbi:MAG: Hsp70 family protein [bacterium]|nr:Hsp70 family protein [bacterium]